MGLLRCTGACALFVALLLAASPAPSLSGASRPKGAFTETFSKHLSPITAHLPDEVLSDLLEISSHPSKPECTCPADDALPASFYASPTSYHLSSLVLLISHCWGPLTASFAFFSAAPSLPAPLFNPSSLDSALAAWRVFSAVEDLKMQSEVANFISTSLSLSSFCETSLPPRDAAAGLHEVFSFVERAFFRVPDVPDEAMKARFSLATCLRKAERAVEEAAKEEAALDLANATFAGTRGAVVARGRGEDVSWLDGVHVVNTERCKGGEACGEGEKERVERIERLSPVGELEGYGGRVHVYSKVGGGGRGGEEGEELPFNLGGEAVVYLMHIIKHYDDLPAVTVFLQGEPIAGAEGATVHFNSLSELHGKLLGLEAGARFQPISNLVLQNDWDTGAPFSGPGHVDLKTGQAELYEMITRESRPEGGSNALWWHACGLFAASKEAVRSRPRYFYEDLYTMLTSGYPPNPSYPRGGIRPGGALDPFCGAEGSGHGGLYCTEYNLHTLFYAVERMWQYVFDGQNELWNLDVCGGDVGELLREEGRGGWRDALCEGEGAREDGWLVPLLGRALERKQEREEGGGGEGGEL